MKIVLNGTTKEIENSMNLDNLIGHYCKNPRFVIAQLNGSLVRNHEWAEKQLKEGDILELVNFVGGG